MSGLVRPLLLALVALTLTACATAPKRRAVAMLEAPRATAEVSGGIYVERWPTAPGVTCADRGDYAQAAFANAAGLQALAVSPFGRQEYGWAAYAPLVGASLGSGCPPDSPDFAADLARWQSSRGLAASGIVDDATMGAFKRDWQGVRPFVQLRGAEVCPAAPPPEALELLGPDAATDWKPQRLRPAAAAALRAMQAAARAEAPELAYEPDALKVFSGFRDPTADEARCKKDNNCHGLVRAACSAHRTGLAVDLVIGRAPGFNWDDSAPENRLHMSRTPAYRWLVANARRFGFVNYAYEPWHWEWTGEAP